MKRYPIVAGRFYSNDVEILKSDIKKYIQPNDVKQTAMGAILPHAGYIYSGMVAGEVISKIVIPGTVLLLGPNHNGVGERVSVSSAGDWEIPFGNIKINNKLAENIIKEEAIIKECDDAHKYEHSIEVQLPFLQFVKNDFDIVPISTMSLNYSDCKKVGHAIAISIKKNKDPVLIIASSDMSHYESRESAAYKDNLAINKILQLDPKGLLENVKKNSISMCGVIPVTIMLIALLELGAKKSTLVKYTDSGEVNGDIKNVVGYAGMMIT